MYSFLWNRFHFLSGVFSSGEEDREVVHSCEISRELNVSTLPLLLCALPCTGFRWKNEIERKESKLWKKKQIESMEKRKMSRDADNKEIIERIRLFENFLVYTREEF